VRGARFWHPNPNPGQPRMTSTSPQRSEGQWLNQTSWLSSRDSRPGCGVELLALPQSWDLVPDRSVESERQVESQDVLPRGSQRTRRPANGGQGVFGQEVGDTPGGSLMPGKTPDAVEMSSHPPTGGLHGPP
jgi:hypothetical protein